jgi:hypothetical protein
MYAQEARQFITKLINMQKGMKKQGFIRHDYSAVSQSITELEKYLKAFKYDSDEKMRGFWNRKENHIRNLIPGQNHPAFKTIINEFIALKP